MDPRVAAVVALVEKEPRIDIRALAVSVHLSPSRLRHLFRAEKSTPLHRFEAATASACGATAGDDLLVSQGGLRCRRVRRCESLRSRLSKDLRHFTIGLQTRGRFGQQIAEHATCDVVGVDPTFQITFAAVCLPLAAMRGEVVRDTVSLE
jgi:hypothetical protein